MAILTLKTLNLASLFKDALDFFLAVPDLKSYSQTTSDAVPLACRVRFLEHPNLSFFVFWNLALQVGFCPLNLCLCVEVVI